jgi:hypothetical protein
MRTVHRGTEAAETQHRRSGGSHQCQRRSGTTGGPARLQRGCGVLRRDDCGKRGVADAVSPVGEQERQLGLVAIGRVGPLVRAERVEEPVDPVDLVE